MPGSMAKSQKVRFCDAVDGPLHFFQPPSGTLLTSQLNLELASSTAHMHPSSSNTRRVREAMPPISIAIAIVLGAAVMMIGTATAALAAAESAAGSGQASGGLLSCDTTVGRTLDAFFNGGQCSKGQKPARGTIQLILAGLPRAGTSSLNAALERIGYSAVHGSDAFSFPDMLSVGWAGQGGARGGTGATVLTKLHIKPSSPPPPCYRYRYRSPPPSPFPQQLGTG